MKRAVGRRMSAARQARRRRGGAVRRVERDDLAVGVGEHQPAARQHRPRPVDRPAAATTRLPGNVRLAPVVAGGTIYVLTEDGDLVALR